MDRHGRSCTDEISRCGKLRSACVCEINYKFDLIVILEPCLLRERVSLFDLKAFSHRPLECCRSGTWIVGKLVPGVLPISLILRDCADRRCTAGIELHGMSLSGAVL